MNLSRLAPYAKTVVAAAAALGVIGAALVDGAITGAEGVQILTALGGVAAVYKTRNAPLPR